MSVEVIQPTLTKLLGAKIVNPGRPSIELPSFELGNVVEQLKHQAAFSDWTQDRFDIAVQNYREYLALCKYFPNERLIPGEDVDQIWHRHILNTKQYYELFKVVAGIL